MRSKSKRFCQGLKKIEAASLGEAIDKAMEKYYAQEIILDAEDMKDVDFRPYEQKQQLGKSK